MMLGFKRKETNNIKEKKTGEHSQKNLIDF